MVLLRLGKRRRATRVTRLQASHNIQQRCLYLLGEKPILTDDRQLTAYTLQAHPTRIGQQLIREAVQY